MAGIQYVSNVWRFQFLWISLALNLGFRAGQLLKISLVDDKKSLFEVGVVLLMLKIASDITNQASFSIWKIGYGISRSPLRNPSQMPGALELLLVAVVSFKYMRKMWEESMWAEGQPWKSTEPPQVKVLRCCEGCVKCSENGLQSCYWFSNCILRWWEENDTVCRVDVHVCVF